jgi:hypothetical protein
MDGASEVVGQIKGAGWVSPEALKRDLHGMVDGLAEQIMGAVNGARKGQLINDSEEPVRVVGHEFIRAAFEAAIQQKIAAAEAAFSPSGGHDDRSGDKEDGGEEEAE